MIRRRLLPLVLLPSAWRGAVAQDVQRIAVGPSRAVRSIAEAARLHRGRAVIEVDAGRYVGDVASWIGADVTLRAIGGRAELLAAGQSAEQKAIWVVRDSQMTVEGFSFAGTRVADGNGAGIRFESGALTVRDCVFSGNQNGILAGNDRRATLRIEASEFGFNGHGDGLTHNLYAGSIASLHVEGSFFHHAQRGHLLKSRAARSIVLHNRLADGQGGNASYELEFPSGGVAIVVGNLIQQAAGTDNPHLISFGVEGYGWPDNRLVLASNTLVDDRASGGIALRVRPGPVSVVAVNNLLFGSMGALEAAGAGGDYRNNLRAALVDVDAEWRPRAASSAALRAVDVGSADGFALQPPVEFSLPRGTRPRREAAPVVGALAAENSRP